MARPLILVTGPDRGGWPLWFFTALNIVLAGGRPRRVMPSRPWRGGRFHGLVLGGGADVDPRLYGSAASGGAEPPGAPPVAPVAPVAQEASEDRENNGGKDGIDGPNNIQAKEGLKTQEDIEEMGREVVRAVEETPGLWRKLLSLVLLPLVWVFRRVSGRNVLGGLDGPRDRLEFDMLGRAELGRVPLLGICRGMQLLNVYRGGTLHRELSGYYGETQAMRTIRPRKWVIFAQGACLRRLTGKDRLRVNALHSQAVDELGRDLRVAAVEDAGVVQAIEERGERFVLGVQWHPELLPQHHSHRAVFRGLVEAAERYRVRRGWE